MIFNVRGENYLSKGVTAYDLHFEIYIENAVLGRNFEFVFEGL
jgi:hypothetical protein